MLKHILATTALSALLVTGLHAQTAPATDPMTQPAAPGTQSGETVAPLDEGVTTPPEVVEDEVTVPGAADTEMAEPATEGTDDMGVAGEWAPIDLATVTSEELIGANIVNYEDETVASIEDVVMSSGGQVESVVARFGGFLGFGADRVLLTLDELEVMQDADEEVQVRTNLTPELIEDRPAYEG